MLIKILANFASLRSNQHGTVAVMMGLLLPILVGGLGLGFEVSNWYLRIRAMQGAADSATLAAASNASSNYDVEAKAVAAQYGFVHATNNVTVVASNTAPCPAGGSNCYSVTISSVVPLYLSQVVGFTGDTTLNGGHAKLLSSAAVAAQANVPTPICMLSLSQTSQGIRSNGGPNTNFTGCNIMSNSSAQCNGSNLQATAGLAHGTNSGCGINQPPPVPIVADPYANILANNRPANPCSSYPQETHHGSTWSGGTALSGTLSLTSTPYTLCGDIQLSGDVTIDAPAGAVIVVQNGQLDLNGHALRTASGSKATIIFTGTTGSYTHAPTDNSGVNSGVLDIQAPTSGPWSGVALYQDPSLTTGVNVDYTGNSPAWQISGLVYMPNANVQISGAVGKSSNGAACMVMVANTILINGTGSFYNQSPAGCTSAGLTMPSATVPGRAQLVY